MKSIVINILFLSCFISSILTLTENSGIWDRIYLIILISIFMLQILIWSNKKYLQIDRATFILTYFYVIFTAISSILNSDYRLLQGGILFFILYYVSFGMYSLFNYEKINKLLFKTIIILYALTVIIPLMVNGIDSTPYQGIFYNPNSLGFISATTFAVVISIFIFSTEKIILNNYRKTNYIKSKFFLYLMLLSFLFYIVVLSGSRTSFLSCILVSIVGFLYLIFYFIKEKKLLYFISRGMTLSILVFIILFLLTRFTNIIDTINYIIIDKFTRKAGSGDILANRGEIWIQTIQDARLFGNGGDYFNNVIQIGSHNTFINILGRYGWIPMIIFIAIVILMIIYSVKYSLINSNDKFKYMPLSLSISFITLSMAENVFNSFVMLAMFISVGSIVFSTKNHHIKNTTITS